MATEGVLMSVTTVRLPSDVRHGVKVAAVEVGITMEEFVTRACLHYIIYLKHPAVRKAFDDAMGRLEGES